MPDAAEQFHHLWKSFRKFYLSGDCVSERGMQAYMAIQLREVFFQSRVVAEPTWSCSSRTMFPDIVVTNETEITDIFELKFKPQGFADLSGDLEKLLIYGTRPDDYMPTRIDPSSGKWEGSLRLSQACRFHFVAVANYEAAAVWSGSIREEVPLLDQSNRRVIHWFGRVGRNNDDENWGINVGI